MPVLFHALSETAVAPSLTLRCLYNTINKKETEGKLALSRRRGEGRVVCQHVEHFSSHQIRDSAGISRTTFAIVLALLFVRLDVRYLRANSFTMACKQWRKKPHERTFAAIMKFPFVDEEASMRFVRATIVQAICSPFYLRPRDFETTVVVPRTRRWRSFFEREAKEEKRSLFGSLKLK